MPFGLSVESITTLIIPALTKIFVALIIWVIGRILINFVVGLLRKALARAQKFDTTIINFITSALSVILTIMLVLGMLGYFGIETTSFAGLLAGVGLAIGAAWGGLLGHLAAGLFLLVLRPFKVGDFVSAGGTTGTVKELGLFGTTINTPDNVLTVVGNNKVFSDTIQNFSANPSQRVICKAQIAHSVDANEAMRMLEAEAAKIPNVMHSPMPSCAIAEFGKEGPVLGLAMFTHNSNYWQVFFDGNKMIKDAFTRSRYPTPEESIRMHN